MDNDRSVLHKIFLTELSYFTNQDSYRFVQRLRNLIYDKSMGSFPSEAKGNTFGWIKPSKTHTLLKGQY
jgi:hypothetical protein